MLAFKFLLISLISNFCVFVNSAKIKKNLWVMWDFAKDKIYSFCCLHDLGGLLAGYPKLAI